MIDSPSFGIPTPTNGAPPPVNDEADWLPIPPIELDDESELPVDPVAPLAVVPPNVVPGELLPPKPLVPEEEDPNAEPDDDPNAEPDDPEVLLLPIPEDIPAADPKPPEDPGSPASGWPKNPFTVVFASPT